MLSKIRQAIAYVLIKIGKLGEWVKPKPVPGAVIQGGPPPTDPV